MNLDWSVFGSETWSCERQLSWQEEISSQEQGESPGRVRKEPDPSLTTGGAKKTVHAAEEADRDGFFPVTAANLFLTLQERGH